MKHYDKYDDSSPYLWLIVAAYIMFFLMQWAS